LFESPRMTFGENIDFARQPGSTKSKLLKRSKELRAFRFHCPCAALYLAQRRPGHGKFGSYE
jgi:hypothetical protein